MNTRDPKHVMIAVATKGEIRWEASSALLQLVTQPSPDGHSFSIVPGGGCDVCHARNLLLHHFVHKTDAGRILFLDSDVVPTADDVLRLLAHDRPFIAGRYPLKGYKLRWSYNRPTEHESGLLNCFEVCTGFYLAHIGTPEVVMAVLPHGVMLKSGRVVKSWILVR